MEFKSLTRGFTLFTALVGFVLIALGFLLANTMIHSENNLQSTISSIDEQSEMQSLSDLLQSDAFQYFNWYFRVLVEQAITSNDIFMSLDASRAHDMQSVIQSFTQSKLNTEGFANKISDALTNDFLGTGRTFKNYRVCLNSCNPDERTRWIQERQPKFQKSLQKLLQAEFDQKIMLEPIDCPNSSGVCTNGSFYVNLDLTLKKSDGSYVISNEEMENFPQISVESSATGRIIRSPILPRSKLRFYVPNRLFKAIWSAREIANKSVFNTRSEDFPDIGLGYCDAGCYPREDPYRAQTRPTIENALCPGTKPDDLSQLSQNDIAQMALNSVPITSCNGEPCAIAPYDPSNTENMKTILENIVRSYVTNTVLPPDVISEGQSYSQAQQFILVDQTIDTSINPVSQSVSSIVDNTKAIQLVIGSQQQVQNTGSGYCVRPQFISATVSFEELNPAYFVMDESVLGPNKKHIYRIQIVSGYLNTGANNKQTCRSVMTPHDSGLGGILNPSLSGATCNSPQNPDGTFDCVCRP